MLRPLFLIALSWVFSVITYGQNSKAKMLTSGIPQMMNQRIPPSDTAFLIRPVAFARTPIRGTIIFESIDKRNPLLERTGAVKVGYCLKSDSTIVGIYLKFPPTDAQSRELQGLLGEPTITASQGIGESFGVIGWRHSGCSIILSMDGPYDWPEEVPRQLVLRYNSIKDIMDSE